MNQQVPSDPSIGDSTGRSIDSFSLEHTDLGIRTLDSEIDHLDQSSEPCEDVGSPEAKSAADPITDRTIRSNRRQLDFGPSRSPFDELVDAIRKINPLGRSAEGSEKDHDYEKYVKSGDEFDLVPKERLLEAEVQVVQAQQEILALQRKMQGMVPREIEENLNSYCEDLGAQVNLLQDLLDSMVPKTKYEAAQEEIRRKELEIRRLKLRMPHGYGRPPVTFLAPGRAVENLTR